MRYDKLRGYKSSEYENVFYSTGIEALLTLTESWWILELISTEIYKTFLEKPFYQIVGISVREDRSCNIYSRINDEIRFSEDHNYTTFPIGVFELYIAPLNQHHMLIFLMSEC